MDNIQQLEHRLAMVLDDIKVIRKHIYQQNIAVSFEKPTPMADDCWTHFNNIEIACDLHSEECLSWGLFDQDVLPTPTPLSKNKETMTELDLESLDRHYFWVERPKAVIRELKKSFDRVDDVSYLNDEVPSVLINGLIKMYLPNSIRHHDMQTNQYGVLMDVQDGFDGADIYVTERLDHAIDKIIELWDNVHPLNKLLTELAQESINLMDSENLSDIHTGSGMMNAVVRLKEVMTKFKL
jgi:hypothetical protein